jgi:predicted RND superfamily exporter protein
LKPTQPLDTAEAQAAMEEKLKASGVPMRVTGWSYAMISLVPWAKRELVVFSSSVGALILLLLGIAYRQWNAWLIHAASLLVALGGTVATLKVAGLQINMLNALAFPLILGVGVDYGLHVLFAARDKQSQAENLLGVLKPLVICGLTTITGFGSLMLARNPALSGLGTVCALGVGWCLASSLLFVLPLAVLGNRS